MRTEPNRTNADTKDPIPVAARERDSAGRSLFAIAGSRLVLVLLAASACKGNNAGADAPAGDGAVVVAAEADFTAGDPGLLSSVVTSTHATKKNISPGAVGDDPMTRVDTTAGFVYVVNRSDGDNVTQLDAATLTTQLQLDTGSGTNPQDIATIGTKWYVATLGGSGLEVADAAMGSAAKFAFIDLGSAAAGDPDCNSVFAVGSNVFVSCELLGSDFEPTGNGLIEVISSTSDTVTASFNLQHPNPFGVFEGLPDGNIAIPTIDFDTGSGCIEEVNVTTNTSAGCLVENSALGSAGSFASRFAVASDSKTIVIAVSAATPGIGALVPFDLSSSTLGLPLSPSSEVIGDVTTCPDGTIAVSDTGSSADGLRLYSTTKELTTSPISVGIDPQSAHGLVCF